MAGQLAGAGVGPADRVVLVADNSADHLAAAFAVWRAGGVLVTIYPSSTEAELAFAIERAEPVAVVAGTRVVATVRAAAGGRPVAELDGTGALAGVPGDRRRPVAGGPGPGLIDPDALALICFTSGSTARPKAVMHSPRRAARCRRGVRRASGTSGPHDATLVCLPMAWAFGLVTTSMAALLDRAAASWRWPAAEPEAMLAAMADDGVTFFAGVTTMFGKLVQHLESRDGPRPDLSRLRLCISGGEPRNEAAFSRWQQLTGCPVHDVYAASECFPVVTYDPVRGSAAAAGQRRPGRGRGCPAAGRPGGPGRAARRHRRGVDPRPGPPGRLLARPRPHGAGR